MFTALEEAVRKGIIFVNPFRKIPRHERLKLKPVYRNAWTLDELVHLMETPCKMEQQYKQAYLFSCFTGLRWSDVNPLQWKEIITKTIDGKEEWFIYFEQEKTEDIEYLPLSDQAVEILKERKCEQKENKEISPLNKAQCCLIKLCIGLWQNPVLSFFKGINIHFIFFGLKIQYRRYKK
jgi:integrase